MTNLPAPHDIVRMTCLLREHQRWSLFRQPPARSRRRAGKRRTTGRDGGHAVEFSRWAEVANVGSGTIEQLDDAIHRATREYLTSPAGALLHCVGCRPRSEPLSSRSHARVTVGAYT